MDIWIKEKRSEVMSKIGSKNTKPELILRSALFKKGFRFRVHCKDLPDKPDIVLTKYQVVSRDWELMAKGTRFTQEFAAFLKGLPGYSSHKR